jgi:hypothetical protein
VPQSRIAHRDTINPQFREGKSTMTRKQKAVGRTHAIVPEQAVQKSQKQKFTRAPNRFCRAFAQYDEGGDATICASRIRYRLLEGRLQKKVEKCGSADGVDQITTSKLKSTCGMDNLQRT